MFGDSGIRCITLNILHDMIYYYPSFQYNLSLIHDKPQDHAVYGLLMYIGKTKTIKKITNDEFLKFYNEHQSTINMNDSSMNLAKKYDFDKYGEYLLDQACFLIICYFVYNIMDFDKKLTKITDNIISYNISRIYTAFIIYISFNKNNFSDILSILHLIANRYSSKEENVFKENEIDRRYRIVEETEKLVINIKPQTSELSYIRLIIDFNSPVYDINFPIIPICGIVKAKIKKADNVIDYGFKSMNFEQKTEHLTKINMIEKLYGLNFTMYSDLISFHQPRHTYIFTILFTSAGIITYWNYNLTFYNQNGQIMGNDNNFIDLASCFRFDGNTLTVKPKRTLLFDTTEYEFQFYFNNRHDEYKNNKPSYFYANKLIHNILNPKQQDLVNKIEQQLLKIEQGDYDDLSSEQNKIMQILLNEGMLDGIKRPYEISDIDPSGRGWYFIEKLNFRWNNSAKKDIPEAPEKNPLNYCKWRHPPLLSMYIKSKNVYNYKSYQPIISLEKRRDLYPYIDNLYNCRHRSLIPEYKYVDYNEGSDFLKIFKT